MDNLNVPPSPTQMNSSKEGKMSKKYFSIRVKLLLIFGLLIITSLSVLGVLSVVVSRKAILEKIETHLIDKASDVADVIDGRINAFWQFLEGVARARILRDADASFKEKTKYLHNEATFNPSIDQIGIITKNGDLYISGEATANARGQVWFEEALKGKTTFSEPFVSSINGKFVSYVSVPIYGDTKNVEAVLTAVVNGMYLSNLTKDIVIGT
ncbi:MAG: cache domain-containing protein, partial [Treponema sp.]